MLQWCGGFSPGVFYVFWGTPRRDLLKSELVCVLSQELRQEEALSSSCTDNVARRTPRARNRAEDDSPPSLAVVVDNYFQENRAKKTKFIEGKPHREKHPRIVKGLSVSLALHPLSSVSLTSV